MCLSIIALAMTSTSLVLVIIVRHNIEDIDEADPVMLQRLKLKARQRWRKALRHIIYSRRKGKPLYDMGKCLFNTGVSARLRSASDL